MEPTDMELAARKRDNALSRAYIRNCVRYVVQAVSPGRSYSVKRGSTTTTVWASTCDAALTKYLRDQL